MPKRQNFRWSGKPCRMLLPLYSFCECVSDLTLSFSVENTRSLYWLFSNQYLWYIQIFIFFYFFYPTSSATVLAHYKTFWLKLPGPVISQGDVTPAPPQSTSVMSTISASTSILPEPVRAKILKRICSYKLLYIAFYCKNKPEWCHFSYSSLQRDVAGGSLVSLTLSAVTLL